MTKSEPYKKAQHKINELQSQIKELEGSGKTEEDKSKDSGSKTSKIHSMSFVDVVKLMPDKSSATKLEKYAQSKAKINVTHKINVTCTIHTSQGEVTISSKSSRHVHATSSNGKKYAIANGGADSSMKNVGDSCIILELTNKTVNVKGFSDKEVANDLPIGITATKVYNDEGNPVILIEDNQIIYEGTGGSIMSINQYRSIGVDVDDCPTEYLRDGSPGCCNMKIRDTTIPFVFTDAVVLLEIEKPTEQELSTLHQPPRRPHTHWQQN